MKPTLLRQRKIHCWPSASLPQAVSVFTAAELHESDDADAAPITNQGFKEVAGWSSGSMRPQKGYPQAREIRISAVKSLVRPPNGAQRCYSVVTKDEFAVAFREQLQTGRSETHFT
jgi:hypothetical protein